MKNFESGRSMVEMLGTLAIIGVLSIGGIAGYSYGMDKYRANETVNDIMIRGVGLLSQSQQNEPNLNEWENDETIYEIDITQDLSTLEYGLKVFNVPPRVCKMIGDSLKDDAVIYVNSEESGGEVKEDPCDSYNLNTMEFYFNQAFREKVERCEKVSCPICQMCDLNTTECVPAPNNTPCQTESNERGVCINATCEVGRCNSASDCTAGQYCADSNISQTYPNPEKCKDMPNMSKHIVLGKTYYLSDTVGTWWNAKNICEALARDNKTTMSLVNLEEFERNNRELYREVKKTISKNLYTNTAKDERNIYYTYGTVDGFGSIGRITGNGGYAFCQDLNENEGQECDDNTACFSCYNGWIRDINEGASCKTVDGSPGVCDMTGECVPACLTNDDCQYNYYCADTNTDPENATPFSCKILPEMEEYSALGRTYYVSKNTPTWWDGKNICPAFGKTIGTSLSLIAPATFNANNAMLSKALRNAIGSSKSLWTSYIWAPKWAQFVQIPNKPTSGNPRTATVNYLICSDPTEKQSPGNECTEDTDCGDQGCAFCSNGWCLQKSDGISCTINGVKSTCKNGVCQRECLSNQDCSSIQFCADTNESDTEANPATCSPIPYYKKYLVHGKSFYVGDSNVSWWDAQNICMAISQQEGKNLSLVSKDEFESNDSFLSKVFLTETHKGPSVWTSTEYGTNQAYSLWILVNSMGKANRNGSKYVLCHDPSETLSVEEKCTSDMACHICVDGYLMVKQYNSICEAEGIHYGCATCDYDGGCTLKAFRGCELEGVDSGCAKCQSDGGCAVVPGKECSKYNQTGYCDSQGICIVENNTPPEDNVTLETGIYTATEISEDNVTLETGIYTATEISETEIQSVTATQEPEATVSK